MFHSASRRRFDKIATFCPARVRLRQQVLYGGLVLFPVHLYVALECNRDVATWEQSSRESRPAMIPASPSDLVECSANRAAHLPPLLRALWLEAHGDWDRAHSITQEIETTDAAWVHAYLHRKEGDSFNAGYWYGRAGRPASTGSLHAEWTALASHLLTVPDVRASTSRARVGTDNSDSFA